MNSEEMNEGVLPLLPYKSEGVMPEPVLRRELSRKDEGVFSERGSALLAAAEVTRASMLKGLISLRTLSYPPEVVVLFRAALDPTTELATAVEDEKAEEGDCSGCGLSMRTEFIFFMNVPGVSSS